jgi:hypothetical protein
MAGGPVIEALERCIDEISCVDAGSLSSDELARACVASTRLVNAALAGSAALLAEFQQRGAWADDGAVSAATWVANRTGERRSELAGRVRVGAALRQVPAAGAAARAGEISFDHARRLADCVRKDPVLAARDEAVLVESARSVDADVFRMVARHWQACAADISDDPPPGDDMKRQERLHLWQMADGWYAVDGTLSPENGAQLHSLLEEFVDRALRAQRDGDPALAQLVPSALRADAVADLVAQHRRRDPGDLSAPDRYRVGIVLNLDDLPEDLPLACCDSGLFRAVINAAGEVLDIGRTTREWTIPIRRGVVLRDGGCVFPGCDRPPSWCDVHHCWEWDHGGPTCVDNGALLCRRHHTFIHAKHWKVIIPRPRGRPVVLRADGTPYVIDQWQPAPGVPA